MINEIEEEEQDIDWLYDICADIGFIIDENDELLVPPEENLLELIYELSMIVYNQGLQDATSYFSSLVRGKATLH